MLEGRTDEGTSTGETEALVSDSTVRSRFHHRRNDGRVQCDLCPRQCRLKDGQRAFCFVREARDGELYLTSYGRASGFCIDPIEKKPLNHFYPGTSVLSFGTAGCNLGCKFCQNWDISKAKEHDRLTDVATPDEIVTAALRASCQSIAFTYNDPVIFAEYAIDTAERARAAGVNTVAVTAGYITAQARPAFFEHLDAVNIDLKGFTERFYQSLCFANLAPVLDTLQYVRHETNVWLEITTLLIPGQNDSPGEVAALCEWIRDQLGPEVPLHFSGYHPDYRLDAPATPPQTLGRARAQALSIGLKHVYTGNVRDEPGQSTYCAGCAARLIARDWYRISDYRLGAGGGCPTCGKQLAGRFGKAAGPWGARRRRLPLGPSL